MDNIVTLHEKEESHATGPARCEKCNHKWQAVVPVGITDFECPKCLFNFGSFLGPCVPTEGAYIWQCNCGWDTFSLTPDGPLCRQCGTIQDGY